MATKRQVETKLRELIGRLDRTEGGAVRALSEALPDSRVVELHVRDLGQSYWTRLSGGRMDALHRGAPERADIRLEADADDLIEALDGTRSLFSSYLAGRIKIRASWADMLRLRKLA